MAIVKSLPKPEQGYPHRIHRKKRKKHFKSQRARQVYLKYKQTKNELINSVDTER